MNPIKKSIKAIGDEPLEFLKSATKQISGEDLKPPQEQSTPSADTEVPQDEQNYKKRVAEQDGRHLQALESELKDIRRQKIFKDLMQRIQNGEDIPLEEFTELSYEQRDVLKAQIEAVKKANSQQLIINSQLQMPESKRGRKMGGGQKQSAQKQTTHVEKPVPPSG